MHPELPRGRGLCPPSAAGARRPFQARTTARPARGPISFSCGPRHRAASPSQLWSPPGAAGVAVPPSLRSARLVRPRRSQKARNR